MRTKQLKMIGMPNPTTPRRRKWTTTAATPIQSLKARLPGHAGVLLVVAVVAAVVLAVEVVAVALAVVLPQADLDLAPVPMVALAVKVPVAALAGAVVEVLLLVAAAAAVVLVIAARLAEAAVKNVSFRLIIADLWMAAGLR